jgi:hypothetical protein
MAAARADGSAGARRASALLGIAVCAETSQSTIAEDSAKVDVRFTFRHAFQRTKLLTYHAQIKSGRSYRANSSTPSKLTLSIDQETLLALSGAGTPGMVIWVPPQPLDRMYWYASPPRAALRTPVQVPREQYVRPSIRYDLSRLHHYAAWSPSFTGQTVGDVDEPSVLKRAKHAYALLKRNQWDHPLVGSLKVTRLAWRHVTRRSKPARQRIRSLRAVPYLKSFLDRAPDRFLQSQGLLTKLGRRTIETRYVLCWYRSALRISGKPHSLLLRIKEEISYPTAWSRYPLSVDDIRQTATLASWWCKIES